jgi:hypothetical protein
MLYTVLLVHTGTYFEDCWYARPQLFFTCHLRPTGGRPPKNPSYKIGPDDLLFQLVFFSTFEELHLPIHGPMEDAEVIKLYDPSPIPCLYVAPVANVLGRVPLIPLFLAGNSTPTIPHKFSKHKGSGFPMGSADTADADGRRGSNVYEVNAAPAAVLKVHGLQDQVKACGVLQVQETPCNRVLFIASRTLTTLFGRRKVSPDRVRSADSSSEPMVARDPA